MFTQPTTKSRLESVLSIDQLENHASAFFSAADHSALARLNHGFHQLNNREKKWLILYQQHFGPLVFKCDFRLQYIAMHLLKMKNSPRRDRADYYFRQFCGFIERHQAKPWAQGFLGAMNFWRRNPTISNDKAIQHLQGAIKNGDFRAAQNLVRIAEVYALRDFLDETCLNCLIQAYDKGITNVTREIGYLYMLRGLNNEENRNNSKAWFTKYLLKHEDPKAAKDFVDLFITRRLDSDSEVEVENHDSNSENEEGEDFDTDQESDFEQENPAVAAMMPENHAQHELEEADEAKQVNQETIEESNAIQALTQILAQFSSGAVAYQIAIIYYRSELDPENEEAEAWFERALMLEHGPAASYVANFVCLDPKKDIHKKLEVYQQGFEYGDLSLAKIIGLTYCGLGSNDKAVAWYKKGFLAGASECALALSIYYLQSNNWDDDPKKVCWIHLAAQCAHPASIRALTEKSPKNNHQNYSTCALLIMHALEFLVSPDPKYCQKLIAKVDREILEKYKAALVEEGLMEPYMKVLFDDLQKEFAKQSNLESKPLAVKQ